MIDPLRPSNRHVVYTAGPISDNPMGQTPEFCAAALSIAKALRRKGWSVICPHANPVIDEWTLQDYLREDLEIISRVDALALLPHWQYSPGTRQEIEFATLRGIPVYDYRALLPDWKG